jgi:hypothetical protein
MSQQQRSATEVAAAVGGAAGSPVTAGERFARALAAKDDAALRVLLADPIDFQALTPRRHWQAATPGEVVDQIVLGRWFDAGDDIQGLEYLSKGRLPGREHVSYLLRVRNADGDHLVEQQAYYNSEDERITWMRVLCSGYQKLPD